MFRVFKQFRGSDQFNLFFLYVGRCRNHDNWWSGVGFMVFVGRRIYLLVIAKLVETNYSISLRQPAPESGLRSPPKASELDFMMLENMLKQYERLWRGA